MHEGGGEGGPEGECVGLPRVRLTLSKLAKAAFFSSWSLKFSLTSCLSRHCNSSKATTSCSIEQGRENRFRFYKAGCIGTPSLCRTFLDGDLLCGTGGTECGERSNESSTEVLGLGAPWSRSGSGAGRGAGGDERRLGFELGLDLQRGKSMG